MKTKSYRKLKFLMGDLASLQDITPGTLATMIALRYQFLIPEKIVNQLSEDRQQIIKMAQQNQQLRILKLKSREKMKAMELCSTGLSFDDACAALLARREKAILILHDSYWQQPGVRIKGVIMPPPGVLRFPFPLMLITMQFHSIFDRWNPVYYNTEKAG